MFLYKSTITIDIESPKKYSINFGELGDPSHQFMTQLPPIDDDLPINVITCTILSQ